LFKIVNLVKQDGKIVTLKPKENGVQWVIPKVGGIASPYPPATGRVCFVSF